MLADCQRRDGLRQGVAEEIRRANEREPGTVPGGWVRWAETLLRSDTDWRRVMAAEIGGFGAGATTASLPVARSLTQASKVPLRLET